MSATELPVYRLRHVPAPAPEGRSGRPSRRETLAIVLAGAAGTAFAIAMIDVAWNAGGHSLAPYQGSVVAFVIASAIGVSFLAAGVAAWWQRPASQVGKLMVAAGTLWYASTLQSTGSPALYAIGYLFTYLPPVIVGHLTLVYPDGRLRRSERWAVVASYVVYLALQGARFLNEGTCLEAGVPGPTTSPCGSSILPALVSADGIAFTTLFWVWVVGRWRAASAPARRVHGPVWLGFSILSAALAGSVLAYLLDLPAVVQLALVLGYGLCMLVLPVAFLSGQLRVRLARLRITDLVLALEEATGPARLRDLLARALEDPTLALGCWSEAAGGYVDAEGRPVAIPEGHSARAVTFVERRDQPLAVLVHDASLAEQRPLVQAAVAAARLAIENARLVEAALNERRMIERDLHDGLQHRLLRLSWLADRADGGPALAEVAQEARGAYTELRQLARGIHPAILTERGLAAAVEELALGARVRVLVDLPHERWPRPVEATAFFTISEALTNAAKHAGAEQVTVRGRRTPGRLTIEVADDGAGGASFGPGTGLRGLHDRAAALGGTLTVDSAPGRGTRLVLDLPCE